MIQINVNAKDALNLLKNKTPAEISKRSRAAMNESVTYIQAEVQKGTPVDMGILRGSIFTEIRGTAIPDMTGIIASPLSYAGFVERGRKPGSKPPPVDALLTWVERHLQPHVLAVSIKTRRATKVMIGDQKTKAIRGVAFLVARAIGKRGIKGKFMFRNAAQRGRRVVSGIFARHFRGL